MPRALEIVFRFFPRSSFTWCSSVPSSDRLPSPLSHPRPQKPLCITGFLPPTIPFRPKRCYLLPDRLSFLAWPLYLFSRNPWVLYSISFKSFVYLLSSLISFLYGVRGTQLLCAKVGTHSFLRKKDPKVRSNSKCGNISTHLNLLKHPFFFFALGNDKLNYDKLN